MNWTESINAAVAALHPGARLALDFLWKVEEDDSLTFVAWAEDRLGPVDPAAVKAKALELHAASLIPRSVTKAQGMMALYNAGLLDQLEGLIANHPYPPVRIWFANANVWERDNPYIHSLGPELGLTEEDIDGLFQAASLLAS